MAGERYFLFPRLVSCPPPHQTSSQLPSLLQKYQSFGEILPRDVIRTACKIQPLGREIGARGWEPWNLAGPHRAAASQPAPGLTHPPLLTHHRLARDHGALWPKDPLTVVTQVSMKETNMWWISTPSTDSDLVSSVVLVSEGH